MLYVILLFFIFFFIQIKFLYFHFKVDQGVPSSIVYKFNIISMIDVDGAWVYESLRCNFVKVYKVLGLTNLSSTSRTSCLLESEFPSATGRKGLASIWQDTATIVPFFFFINQIIKIFISIIVVHADLFVCYNFFTRF